MFGRKTSRILVIKTDGLAHFVAAEPAFAAIRQAYPKAQISLLTTAELQRISRASPYFHQVAALPNMRDAEARKEFIKQLKAAKFERVFDLANDDTGKRLFGAMGAFGPKWHAAAQNPLNRKRHSASFAPPDTNAALKSAAVECVERLPDFHWALEARKDSANMQPSWYGISGVFGVLLPGENPESRWTAAGYGGLANIMSQSGVMPVLAGPKTLHAFGDEIADHAPQLVDLTGKTDHLQLAALAHEAAFFVTDHAEEMHLAVSIGAEGVVIAPASPMPTAPEGRHVVSLTSQAGAGAVDPIFVWRTLSNMGLISTQTIAPQSVGVR